MKMKKNKIIYPVGVIDVGSNSVRLMFTDGIFTTKNLMITRLGGGFLPDGSLSASAMLVTANAINKLKNLAIQKGAKSVMVFATAAVRKATNKSEFVSLVKDIDDLDVDVVDVNPTIGGHCGPDAVGIAFHAKGREI